MPAEGNRHKCFALGGLTVHKEIYQSSTIHWTYVLPTGLFCLGYCRFRIFHISKCDCETLDIAVHTYTGCILSACTFIFYLICSAEPPEVALVMAHAASFLVRNSATCRIVMSGGSRPASITIYKWKKILNWQNAQICLKTSRLHCGTQHTPVFVLCFLQWCWRLSSRLPSWWTPWGYSIGEVETAVLNSSESPMQ